MKQWVYKNNIIKLLEELADKDYQIRIWLNTDNPKNLVGSFDEAANMLFDSSIIDYLLAREEIIFDRAVTNTLRELSKLVDEIDEYRPEEDIINDPLMQIVREKAAKTLALIEASDDSESTVDIIE